MVSEESDKPAFTQVIDLTSRAQQNAREERTVATLQEPDPALPRATIDTLSDTIRRAVISAGWNSLMPVQELSIPYLVAGRDMIVQSRTGSGKTGAFLLPLFERLDSRSATTQALLLCPTRELARQIHEEFEAMQRAFVDDEYRLESALVYGGVKYKSQNTSLKGGAQVVIGTPGRILDHLERRTFTLDDLKVLVLDEADEMLSMGFYPAMKQLRRYLPASRNSYMFSATMPPKVRSLAQDFLRDPGFLSLSSGQIGVDSIEHRYYVASPMEKDRVLVRIIEMENPDSAIIFANTKRDVEYLAKFLRNFGYDASEISGDLDQRAREKVMDRIRKGDLRYLVATDVAARGIDISDLSHVFMYDVPQDPEYYIHRSGRTARAGKTGTAIVVTTATEKNGLLRITKKYGVDTQQHEVPSSEDVEVRVAERMTIVLEERMREKTDYAREHLGYFVPLVERLSAEKPTLLSILVDDVYLAHSLGRLAEPEEIPEDARGSNEELMEDRLEAHLKGKSNLTRVRGERFVPLVQQLVAEEPELLAMLVDELDLEQGAFVYREPPPPEPRRDREEEERLASRRPPRSGSGRPGGRSGGGGRRR
ncbi:MAG: DEAD/DEAH box helicase [Rhodothermales bacterium]|nr:DEAD/DEAH box helicase [Rhodothermales bacterium]